MNIKTHITAGGLFPNHSQSTAGFKVKTNNKAGGLFANHNQR